LALRVGARSQTWMHKEMIDKFIINQSGSLDSGFGIIQWGQHVLASGNLFKAMSSGLVSVQVSRGASKDQFMIIFPHMEGVVNARIESNIVSSLNHLGEAKDVGDVIRFITDFAKRGNLSFEVQIAGGSVGVHGDRLLCRANISNKVWIADCAVNAGARV